MYTDPTGESGIVGAVVGAAVEIGMQARKNYRRGCDVIDPRNYDWWDIVVPAGIGAAGPGWLGVGKSTWRFGGAIKNLSEQAGRARTANRAQKIGSRINVHKDTIKGALITQGRFQGAKEAGKHINDFFNLRMSALRIDMKKHYIYLLGICGLGLVYPSIKQVIGGGAVFAGAVLCIVVIISWVAHRFGK